MVTPCAHVRSFDEDVVIDKDRQVYFGPTSEARSYSEGPGYKSLSHQSTVDYLADCVDSNKRQSTLGGSTADIPSSPKPLSTPSAPPLTTATRSPHWRSTRFIRPRRSVIRRLSIPPFSMTRRRVFRRRVCALLVSGTSQNPYDYISFRPGFRTSSSFALVLVSPLSWLWLSVRLSSTFQ